MPTTAPSCAIVIFGASGDLAQRKLIPAIYEMARENLLNENSYVVGFARSPMSRTASLPEPTRISSASAARGSCSSMACSTRPAAPPAAFASSR